MHPIVLKQFNFPENSSKHDTDNERLLSLIILFIKQDEGIHTSEWVKINAGLPVDFDFTICSEPYGGSLELLKSLNFKKNLPSYVAEQLSKTAGISNADFESFSKTSEGIILKTEPKNEKQKLIQEIVEKPCWQICKSKTSNSLVYKIRLPAETDLRNCELDISTVTID